MERSSKITATLRRALVVQAAVFLGRERIEVQAGESLKAVIDRFSVNGGL